MISPSTSSPNSWSSPVPCPPAEPVTTLADVLRGGTEKDRRSIQDYLQDLAIKEKEKHKQKRIERKLKRSLSSKSEKNNKRKRKRGNQDSQATKEQPTKSASSSAVETARRSSPDAEAPSRKCTSLSFDLGSRRVPFSVGDGCNHSMEGVQGAQYGSCSEQQPRLTSFDSSLLLDLEEGPSSSFWEGMVEPPPSASFLVDGQAVFREQEDFAFLNENADFYLGPLLDMVEPHQQCLERVFEHPADSLAPSRRRQQATYQNRHHNNNYSYPETECNPMCSSPSGVYSQSTSQYCIEGEAEPMPHCLSRSFPTDESQVDSLLEQLINWSSITSRKIC